jgi:hypothetical protein
MKTKRDRFFSVSPVARQQLGAVDFLTVAKRSLR